MTILQRLTAYPHAAVFDKAPADELVFRLRHANGATWTISDAVMTARAGVVATTYDLASLTVTQLSTALTGAGYQVTELRDAFADLSALVLVEGRGDQGTSNGDRVTGYTSLMWALMGGYAVELRQASAQVIQALRQMVITQAEGEWLDLWGKLYAVGRAQNEADGNYAPRIPKEAFRLRESPIAIEEAVKDATGKTIRIEEPWSNVFRLDNSLLSGPDKFQDGTRVGYFLIQPTSTTPLDWTDVLPVIHRNRAAGVLVLPPFSRNVIVVDGTQPGVLHTSITSTHTRKSMYEDRTLLDYSLIEDIPILNHAALHRQEILHRSGSTILGWFDVPWPPILWPDEPYYIQSYYFRSYRVYSTLLRYESQYWPDIPWAEVTWEAFNVVISTMHTRTGEYDLLADGSVIADGSHHADGYI